MEDNREKLITSLIVITKCQRSLYNISEFILNRKKNPVELRKEIENILMAHFSLELDTFLEKYNSMFIPRLKKYNLSKFNTVKSLTGPLIKRLKKWDGVKAFRNETIAHGWTDGVNLKLPLIGFYNVPSNHVEIVFAANLVKTSVNIVRKLLREECLRAVEVMKEKYDESLKNKRQFSVEEINLEIRVLNEELLRRAKENNVSGLGDFLTLKEYALS